MRLTKCSSHHITSHDSYIAETLEKLFISGSSVGAIAAPLWLDTVASLVPAHSYVLLADSLVLNMPEAYQPDFFALWGFCGSVLMPSEYSEDCETRNFSHVDLHILAMQKHPNVPFVTVTSKLDNTATSAYNRFVEDRGGTLLWPTEFQVEIVSVLERLNQEPNFVAYVISSFNHLFMTRSRYYDATEFGDMANTVSPVNGRYGRCLSHVPETLLSSLCFGVNKYLARLVLSNICLNLVSHESL
jgi:hypothetical protein